MTRLLIKNAQTIVTCNKHDEVLEHVNLLIENGVITYMGKKTPSADQQIDASHHIVYPGLINTHHHLYQTFTRNLPAVQNMELFDWLNALYKIWANLDQKVVYYSSITGLGELLKSGCTTAFDHHYVFPQGEETGLMEAQFQAASELGIRLHASRGSMSLSQKDGGLPPDSVVQNVDTILKDSERIVAKFHDPKPFSMRQVVLAPCSPFSVTSELMKETAKLARHLGVRLHTHLAETKDEEQFVLKNFGMRPLAYMESLGWTGNDVWYAHGIHFNHEELEFLAKTQTGVAHCPISNMKLSSGICQVAEMLKLGVPVGLGVDGSASNDASNLLEDLRVGFLLQRLNSSNQAPTGYDFLKMATNGSAKLLGRDDIGSLAVGKAGDLFMLDTRDLSLVGTLQDPKAVLGTVGFSGAVAYTVVNGQIVVKQGKLVNLDEEKFVADANQLQRQFIARSE
ncbi:8-oxoguanine deaminase [Loigolactobacillus jiayinensis]|uniref:8-oxoguanine deaminase n=1 Tax=Loigolactobacillus jiayinensis TaxID=2486016 RepID=A0ABW1RAV2_9LACO|nr:8-oxoguanine deaminase [Loigolactobacillus jiayinensis]